MSNGYLTGCALAIAFLMTIAFSLKRTVKNIETQIYRKMLYCNILESLTTTLIVIVAITINSNFVLKLLNRIDVIAITTWCSLLFYYIFSITKEDKNKKIKRFVIITNLIIYILALFLDVKIIVQDNILDSAGPLTNMAVMVAIFYVILMLGVLFFSKNKKRDIDKSKYIPVYMLIFFLVTTAVLRIIIPEINFASLSFSLINMIMIFTIENPDVKLINQLNIARDHAEKANKAKTEFLSNMSHEIRTPLNAIVGFSECLLTSNDLKENKEFAKDIVYASGNLLEIVNGILDISKIEANKMEIIPKEYNPREVFQSLAKLVQPRIGEKPIEFQTHISEDLPGVLRGDMGKVKQVILNLLTNAAKYTDKGQIDFSVTCVNRMNEKKCLLYIAVKDTGRGIKPQDMNKLFNKFERMDEDKNATIEGTGLGLAITKRLAEMMGGKVTVNSVYGEGSVFRIYLEQEIISMEIPENSGEEIEINYEKHQGKRILVVDDSKMNLKVANQILKPYHFTVVLAESGFESLELMETQTFDLILMDIMMPKMNGVETLRRLKEIEGFNIPVVALTADALEGTDDKYKSAGFDDFLSKPINKQELDRVLNKFLK